MFAEFNKPDSKDTFICWFISEEDYIYLIPVLYTDMNYNDRYAGVYELIKCFSVMEQSVKLSKVPLN